VHHMCANMGQIHFSECLTRFIVFKKVFAAVKLDTYVSCDMLSR